MVEQRPNQQPKTQVENIDPQKYSQREGGLLGNVRKKISRRVFAPVAVTLGLGGFLGGCGDENKPSETSKQTNITQPITTEDPTTSILPSLTNTTRGEQTSTTEVNKSDLLTIQELSFFDLPSELSNKILERVSDVDKIIFLEAQQAKDSDKKVSMYFVNSGNKDYVVFSTKEGYTMDRYSAEMEIRGDNQETVLKYFNQKHKPFLEFKFGEEFAKKEGDTKISYLQRIDPFYFPAEKDVEKARELIKKTEKLTISDPNSIRGNSVSYTSEQQEEIDKIIEILDPGDAFTKSIENPVDMNKANFEQILPAFEDLIIEDSSFKTFEDFRKNSVSLTAESIPKEFTDQVPQEIQDAFQKINPEYKILYVGDGNRGLEMNAVITNRPVKITAVDSQDASRFGTLHRDGTTSVEEGVFTGFYVLEEKFIMDILNPIKNTHRYYVLNMDPNDGNNTGLGMDNLGAPAEDDPFEARGWQYRLPNWLNKDSKRKVSDMIQIGDTMMIGSISIDEITGLPLVRGIHENGSNERFQQFLNKFP